MYGTFPPKVSSAQIDEILKFESEIQNHVSIYYESFVSVIQ